MLFIEHGSIQRNDLNPNSYIDLNKDTYRSI